ncbi:MAG: inositol monophosphatase [Candidatus Kapabacteria bacterium]|nr:inositol monophosphatase [Candidatus Kapabacteria bacterium]MDW8011821.1 inositol monophosphatase family protein [Bacteroidota bacterium]
MKPSAHELLANMVEAALEAGALLRTGFGSSLVVERKDGRHNLVTNYDRRAEALIVESLRRRFPDSAFWAEESGHSGSAHHRLWWLVDPLDGTVNFAHGIPIFCVSIAALYEQEVLCGVIYQPLLGELFTAIRGEGAWLNGERLHVSQTTQIEDAILVTGFPYNVADNPGNCMEHFLRFLHLGIPVRRLGSAALDLAYVAAGRFDGFWEVALQPWDVAAGILLVQEAGGRVTHYDGTAHRLEPRSSIVASNGQLHEQMLRVLQD